MAVDSNVFNRNLVLWDWFSDPVGRMEHKAGRMANATTGSDGLYTGYAGYHRSSIDIYNANKKQYHIPLIHGYVNDHRNIYFENHTDSAGDTYVRPQGSQIGGYSWFPLCWVRTPTLIDKHYGSSGVSGSEYLHLDPYYTPRNASYSFARDDINNNIAVQDQADPYGSTGPEKKANMLFDLMRQYNLTAGYKIAVCPVGLGADDQQSSTPANRHRLYNHPADAVTGTTGTDRASVYHSNGIAETRAWMVRFVAQWKLRIERGAGAYSYPGTFAFDIENKDNLENCLVNWHTIVNDPRFSTETVARKRHGNTYTLSRLWNDSKDEDQWNVTGSTYPSNIAVHNTHSYVTGSNAYSTVRNRPWTKWFKNTIQSNDYPIYLALRSTIQSVMTNTRVGNYNNSIGRSDIKTGLASEHLWLVQETNNWHLMDLIQPKIYGIRTAAMAAQRYDLVNASVLPVTVNGDERGSHASWLQANNYTRNDGTNANWNDMVWNEPAPDVYFPTDNGLPQWVYPGLSQSVSGPAGTMGTSSSTCTRYWPSSYPDRYPTAPPSNAASTIVSTRVYQEWKGVTGTTSHLTGDSTTGNYQALDSGLGNSAIEAVARLIKSAERHKYIYEERQIEIQRVFTEYWKQMNWGVNYTKKLMDMDDKDVVPWILGPSQSDMVDRAGDFMSPARSQQTDGIGDYGDLYDGVPFGHKVDNTYVTGDDTRKMYSVAFDDMLHRQVTQACVFSSNTDSDGFDFLERLCDRGDVLTKKDTKVSFTVDRKVAGTLQATINNVATQGRNWGWRDRTFTEPKNLQRYLTIAKQQSVGYISGPGGVTSYVANPTLAEQKYEYKNCNIFLCGDPWGGTASRTCPSCADDNRSTEHCKEYWARGFDSAMDNFNCSGKITGDAEKAWNVSDVYNAIKADLISTPEFVSFRNAVDGAKAARDIISSGENFYLLLYLEGPYQPSDFGGFLDGSDPVPSWFPKLFDEAHPLGPGSAGRTRWLQFIALRYQLLFKAVRESVWDVINDEGRAGLDVTKFKLGIKGWPELTGSRFTASTNQSRLAGYISVMQKGYLEKDPTLTFQGQGWLGIGQGQFRFLDAGIDWVSPNLYPRASYEYGGTVDSNYKYVDEHAIEQTKWAVKNLQDKSNTRVTEVIPLTSLIIYNSSDLTNYWYHATPLDTCARQAQLAIQNGASKFGIFGTQKESWQFETVINDGASYGPNIDIGLQWQKIVYDHSPAGQSPNDAKQYLNHPYYMGWKSAFKNYSSARGVTGIDTTIITNNDALTGSHLGTGWFGDSNWTKDGRRTDAPLDSNGKRVWGVAGFVDQWLQPAYEAGVRKFIWWQPHGQIPSTDPKPTAWQSTVWSSLSKEMCRGSEKTGAFGEDEYTWLNPYMACWSTGAGDGNNPNGIVGVGDFISGGRQQEFIDTLGAWITEKKNAGDAVDFIVYGNTHYKTDINGTPIQNAVDANGISLAMDRSMDNRTVYNASLGRHREQLLSEYQPWIDKVGFTSIAWDEGSKQELWDWYNYPNQTDMQKWCQDNLGVRTVIGEAIPVKPLDSGVNGRTIRDQSRAWQEGHLVSDWDKDPMNPNLSIHQLGRERYSVGKDGPYQYMPYLAIHDNYLDPPKDYCQYNGTQEVADQKEIGTHSGTNFVGRDPNGLWSWGIADSEIYCNYRVLRMYAKEWKDRLRSDPPTWESIGLTGHNDPTATTLKKQMFKELKSSIFRGYIPATPVDIAWTQTEHKNVISEMIALHDAWNGSTGGYLPHQWLTDRGHVVSDCKQGRFADNNYPITGPKDWMSTNFYDLTGGSHSQGNEGWPTSANAGIQYLSEFDKGKWPDTMDGSHFPSALETVDVDQDIISFNSQYTSADEASTFGNILWSMPGLRVPDYWRENPTEHSELFATHNMYADTTLYGIISGYNEDGTAKRYGGVGISGGLRWLEEQDHLYIDTYPDISAPGIPREGRSSEIRNDMDLLSSRTQFTDGDLLADTGGGNIDTRGNDDSLDPTPYDETSVAIDNAWTGTNATSIFVSQPYGHTWTYAGFSDSNDHANTRITPDKYSVYGWSYWYSKGKKKLEEQGISGTASLNAWVDAYSDYPTGSSEFVTGNNDESYHNFRRRRAIVRYGMKTWKGIINFDHEKPVHLSAYHTMIYPAQRMVYHQGNCDYDPDCGTPTDASRAYEKIREKSQWTGWAHPMGNAGWTKDKFNNIEYHRWSEIYWGFNREGQSLPEYMGLWTPPGQNGEYPQGLPYAKPKFMDNDAAAIDPPTTEQVVDFYDLTRTDAWSSSVPLTKPDGTPTTIWDVISAYYPETWTLDEIKQDKYFLLRMKLLSDWLTYKKTREAFPQAHITHYALPFCFQGDEGAWVGGNRAQWQAHRWLYDSWSLDNRAVKFCNYVFGEGELRGSWWDNYVTIPKNDHLLKNLNSLQCKIISQGAQVGDSSWLEDSGNPYYPSKRSVVSGKGDLGKSDAFARWKERVDISAWGPCFSVNSVNLPLEKYCSDVPQTTTDSLAGWNAKKNNLGYNWDFSRTFPGDNLVTGSSVDVTRFPINIHRHIDGSLITGSIKPESTSIPSYKWYGSPDWGTEANTRRRALGKEDMMQHSAKRAAFTMRMMKAAAARGGMPTEVVTNMYAIATHRGEGFTTTTLPEIYRKQHAELAIDPVTRNKVYGWEPGEFYLRNSEGGHQSPAEVMFIAGRMPIMWAPHTMIIGDAHKTGLWYGRPTFGFGDSFESPITGSDERLTKNMCNGNWYDCWREIDLTNRLEPPLAMFNSRLRIANTLPVDEMLASTSKVRALNVMNRSVLGPDTDFDDPNPTFTPTPTQTSSVTPTPTNTASVTPTTSVTPTQTPTNTPTQTVTSTPNATATAALTVAPTNSPTPTQSPTSVFDASPSPTPSQTVTPTNTPSQTVTPTATPTNTPTNTPTQTPTNTPSQTVSPTVTPSQTVTPTATPTQTPTNTPSQTVTPTQTVTQTPTQTASPTVTPTQTVTPSQTATVSPTASVSPTVSPTASVSPSVTATPTMTPTPSVTPSTSPELFNPRSATCFPVGTPGLVVNTVAIWTGDTLDEGLTRLIPQANGVWNPRILVNSTGSTLRYIVDMRTINRNKPYGCNWTINLLSNPWSNNLPSGTLLRHTTQSGGDLYNGVPTGGTYVKEYYVDGVPVEHMYEIYIANTDQQQVYYLEILGYSSPDGRPPDDDQGAFDVTWSRDTDGSSPRIKSSGKDIPVSNIAGDHYDIGKKASFQFVEIPTKAELVDDPTKLAITTSAINRMKTPTTKASKNLILDATKLITSNVDRYQLASSGTSTTFKELDRSQPSSTAVDAVIQSDKADAVTSVATMADINKIYGATTEEDPPPNTEYGSIPTVMPIPLIINRGCPNSPPVHPNRIGRRIRKVGLSAGSRSKRADLKDQVRNIGNRLDTDE